jgi:membrane-bound lytic murein transglycosylase A
LAPIKKFRRPDKIILSLSLLLLGGCSILIPKEPLLPPEPWVVVEREFPEPLRDDGDRSSLEASIEKSLTALDLDRSRSSRQIPMASQSLASFFPSEKIVHSLILFQELLKSTSDPKELDRQIRTHFSLWQIQKKENPRPILLTGYFEPILEGSLEPGGAYRYPLYRRPDDLVELPPDENTPEGRRGERRIVRLQNGRPVPYYSRDEIDRQGALEGKGYELLWLKDPWDRYLLHIQGSGQILLPDGRILRVGFAASNGRPYRSIGRVLVERGFLSEEEQSAWRIQKFALEFPRLMEEIFSLNERYIFFRFLETPEGPIGALGIPLTPGRSVAADLSIFPRGAIAYLVAWMPVVDPVGKKMGRIKTARFVLIQDTGAAMRGPARIDLFIGSGSEAGQLAGWIKEEGEIYILLPR